ncbi:DUF1761 domain-containing protein [Candidatus Gracilibacteria bacterium]|nr:DUF1761 domain-containing protein [Thermales bacterium]NJL97252.1 DUF1761 domain-containing protein [Candidatus Gracilibacteria bacterium]
MSIPDVNLVAVLVTTVLSFVVGYLWYGPIFGKAWMENKGLTEKDITDGGSSMGYTLITSIIGMYLLGVFVAWSQAMTWMEGATTGLLMATLVGTFDFHTVVYDKTKGINNRFKDWLLHLGYVAIYLAIAGAIFAVW